MAERQQRQIFNSSSHTKPATLLLMHTVIYIPGLGDSRVTGQQLAIKTWKFWGVRPVLFQVNWADGKSFAPKLDNLLELIDKSASKGKVSVVAASAGATAAINAYAARPQQINGVVCIAGKINNPRAISDYYRQTNLSFWESAQASGDSLVGLTRKDRQRILSIRAMVDLIVPARDSKLDGAHNKVVWTSGHALTIGTQLIFGAPSFLRFLRSTTAV